MKKDFCIDCKFPLIRNLVVRGGSNTSGKACKSCARIVAPRASMKPMRSKKK